MKIQIIAEVDGVMALAEFETKSLSWLPVDAPHKIDINALPKRVHEIIFDQNNKGLRQIITGDSYFHLYG